jgi:hypothetical protein
VTVWLRQFPRGALELAWLWCFERLDQLIPEREVSKSNGYSLRLRS